MIPKPDTLWQPVTIPVAECPRTSAYKVRQEDHAQVLRYALDMEQGATLPPIKIANVRGKMHVVDGYHRLAASRHLGRQTIEALVGKMTASTARAWAIDANATNGLALTSADRRPIFAMYMKGKLHLRPDGRHKSGRTIATELASALGTLLSHSTVTSWMREYRDTEFKYDPDRPKPDRRFDDEPSMEEDKVDEVNTSLAYIKRVYWGTDDADTRETIKRSIARELSDIDTPIYVDADDTSESTLDI